MKRAWLAAWAGALALLGWALMTLGAFVRASESGLGCPDWPSCHDQLVAGGHHAMIEELHRWLAATLAIGVICLAAAVLRSLPRERQLTRPLIWMLALLALQVALGGMTVLLRNVSWTVVIHYGAAALLVAAITLLAVRLALPTAQPAPRDSFSRLIGWLVALSLGLLLAGSTVSNTDSHTACGRGFPLCNGSLLPALDHRVAIDLIHRVWALAVLALALWALFRSRQARAGVPAIGVAALTVSILYLAQAGIGIAVVGLGENTAIDVLHSSVGSLTWVALMVLLALTWTLPPGRARRGEARSPVSPLRGG